MPWRPCPPGLDPAYVLRTRPVRRTVAPARKKAKPKLTGTVLGDVSEIPVGGGAIYTAAKVVVTQPASGQYKAFSAVCTWAAS